MNPVQNIISQVFLIVFGLMILSFKKESRAARALVYLGVILCTTSITFFISVFVIAYSAHEAVYMTVTYLAGAAIAITVFLKAINKINFKKMFKLLGIEALFICLLLLFLIVIL